MPWHLAKWFLMWMFARNKLWYETHTQKKSTDKKNDIHKHRHTVAQRTNEQTFLFILLDIYFFKNIKRYTEATGRNGHFYDDVCLIFCVWCSLFFSCDYGFSFWLRLLLVSSDTQTHKRWLCLILFRYEFMCDLLYYGVFLFVGEMMELCFLIIIISTESRFLIACSKVRDVQR